MAQDKEEAAFPPDTAPDDPVQDVPVADADRQHHSGEVPPGRLNDSPESPEVETLPDEETDAPAPDSPEPAPEQPTAAEPAVAPAAGKTVRRILPARPSSTGLGSAAAGPPTPWSWLRKLTALVVVAWTLFVLGLLADRFLGRFHLLSGGLFGLAVVVAGAVPAIGLVRQARRFSVPVALLPMVAALGAIVLGHWRDAALLLTCYLTLIAIREFIAHRSEEPLHALTAARVSQAKLAGSAHSIPIKEVTAGDTIEIGTDEIVPLDGIVERGSTTVEQAIVTGSAEPVEKQRGSDVYAGSRNLGEPIEVRVTRRPSQRTIVRVAKLARTTLDHPSRAEQMLDDIVGPYALAMLAAGLVSLLVLIFLGDHTWRSALERVVAFLIAASPAALLLVIGLGYRAAMANALRNGVLFRGQDELEILGTVRTIAFDKTGTLTQGKPVVTGVVNCTTGWTDAEILARAASAELHSGHRLGSAILAAAREDHLEIPEPASTTPSPGKGIVATVDERTVAVGNANLFAELGVNIWRAIEISSDMRDDGQSAVLVGDRENVRGVVGVSDPLRTEAPAVVADLGTLRIRRTVMLTGDDEAVANVIADDAGLREVYADLLPEEKLGVVRQMEQSAPVGMVAGAGENSPTLAIATSGIALGSVSADVTREPAGVLLFGGELAELPFALWIAQAARRTNNAGTVLLIGVMAILATGALVVGIPTMAVILVWFAVALAIMIAAARLLWTTRRKPRRRMVRQRLDDGEPVTVAVEAPKPRYLIEDDEDDEDDEDL